MDLTWWLYCLKEYPGKNELRRHFSAISTDWYPFLTGLSFQYYYPAKEIPPNVPREKHCTRFLQNGSCFRTCLVVI
jgi:hypothetical protein